MEAAGDKLNFELRGEGEVRAEVDVVCSGVKDDRLLVGVRAMKDGDVRGLDNDDDQVSSGSSDDTQHILIFPRIVTPHWHCL